MRKVILPFVLLLFVFGCVKDENELSNETKTNNVLSVKYIDIEEIGVEIPILNPVIETHKMLALSSSSSNKARATQQEVNALKDVLVVYEEDEAVSYSVSFENQSIERFANVVVVKDENEVSQTIVIEYVPDAESVRLYNTGRIGIDELSGTMYVYGSLVDYIDQAQTKRQPQPKGKTPLFMSNPCGNMFGFNFGNGSMTGGGGGGGSGGTTVCSVVKTVKPCKAGGAGEHGPSECGVGTGSTTIIRYQCSNINYKASISSTLSNMLNAIFLVGPCGSSVSPRGNIGINAQYKPATPCFDEAICAKADALIDELNRLLDTPLSKQLEKRIYEGGAFFDFAEAAVVALENGGEVDVENRLIYNPQVAQNYKTRMSPAEIAIFDMLTPLQKEGYLRAATQAYIYAETHFPKPVRNRKGDAFKHAFWNALSTVYIGETLTEQLTTAHEDIEYDSNYPNHYKETQMDFHNNSQGRQIAYGQKRLYKLVQEALNNGELRYLSHLEFTTGFWRATDSSQLIPTN